MDTHLVSHRGLRPAADELSQHPRCRGMGDGADGRVGPDAPAAGSVGPVWPRLGEREVHRQRRDAATVPAPRVCPGVDARNERRRGGRRGHGCHRSRRGFQQVAGQAEGQGRARGENDDGQSTFHRHRPSSDGAGAPRHAVPAGERGTRARRSAPANPPANPNFARQRMQFFAREGVVAVLEPGNGRNDHGAIIVQGPNQNRDPKEPPTAAQIVVASEHYNRIARLLDRNDAGDDRAERAEPLRGRHARRRQCHRRDPRHRSAGRGGDARRALRLVARGHRRHRQRGRFGGDDGGDAHPQGDGASDAAHGAAGALDGRGTGAPRVARVREAAFWRSRHDAAQAGARHAVGLLQHGQRDRRDSRRVPAGKRGGAPDVQPRGWSRSATWG